MQLQLLATLLDRLQVKEAEVIMFEFCLELARSTLKGIFNPGGAIAEGIIALIQLMEEF